mgnify:CR=1 FL=1
MKLNKKVLSIIALAGTIAFAGVQASDRSEGRHQGHKFEKMAKKLDLSAEQQEAIKSIFEEFKAQRTTVDREAMKAKHLEMKEKFAALMAAPTLDEAAVTAHFAEMSAKKNERQLNKMKMQHAIYQQLTAEQQPMYLKMLAKKMRKIKHKNRGKHGDYKHRISEE